MIITVPDVFEGPRHSRARAIWRAAAVKWWPRVSVRFQRRGGQHIDQLRAWKDFVRQMPGFTHVFAEMDFLPYPDLPDSVATALKIAPAVGVSARHRASGDEPPVRAHGVAGGWFLALSPRLTSHPLDFTAHGQHYNDPGNLLQDQIEGLDLLSGHWESPGFDYNGYGFHTFWSRAWNNNLAVFPAGFDGRAILAEIDKHLRRFEELWGIE